ncbi:MAG TPA: hypothetical protein VF715_15595 [Thermoleophilaceae bacterium]
MIHRYEAYGLAIGSNRPLPGLRPSETSPVDVRVEFDEAGAPHVDDRAADTTTSTGWGAVRGCEDGGRLLLYASHGGESAWSMRVSGDGGSIEVRWRGPVAVADIAAFVETGGLPTALALRGVPLLHACAVDIGSAAFLVLGAGGAGKSSVAAAAVARGHALLTDDIAALDAADAGIRVHPGSSQLRMNEDSAAALGWDPAELRRLFVTPTLPPKLFARLSTEDGSLCAGARRVAAIFVLGERGPGPVEIERLAPAAALRAVLHNTFGERAVDSRVRARLVPFWTRLAREVPSHAVTPPDGLAEVPALVGALTAAAAAY